MFRFITLRQFRLRPGRALFSVLGIACGITLCTAISIINDATSNYFTDSMAAISGKATITISSGETGFSEQIADDVEKTAGVDAAVPVVETRSWLSSTNESVLVLGVDLLQESQVRKYKSAGKPIIGDALSFIAQPDSIILTEAFVKHHGYKMGDPIELSTAQGKKKFTLRGILAPSGMATAYGGGLAIMDIDAAKLAFGKQGRLDRLDVVTRKGSNVDQIAKAIRDRIGQNFLVERPEAYARQMDQMIGAFQFISRFFSSLALIVGMFLISNSISSAIAERRKEIGTLRALGMKQKGILFLFLSEVFVLGLVGSVLGALCGKTLARTLVGSVSRAMTQQYGERIEITDLKFTGVSFAVFVGIGALTSVVAAFFPALRATKIEPIVAMKSKETSDEVQAQGGFYRYAGWIGLFSLIISGIASFLIQDPKMKFLQSLTELAAILGAALLGPVLVIGIMRFFEPVIRSRASMSARLGIENLLRNPRRTSVNITSLLVGLTFVVILACINVSFKGTLVKFFNRILHADLIISATGRMSAQETQPLPDEIKYKIEEHPGVLGAYELREVKINFDREQILLKYFGEPPVPDARENRYDIFDLRDRDTEEVGPEFYHSKDPVLIVSENFAQNFHKRTGDTVTVPTQKGPKSFRIIGVAGEFANPVGTIFMSRANYLRFFGDPLVSGFAVKLKHGFDPVKVRRELDQRLSKDYKLTILLNNDIRNQIDTVIDSSFAYTHAIKLAALLVALFGLMNTLLISILERKRELGLLRAIGMTRRQIARMIFVEATSMGGLGAFISIVLGLGVGLLWVKKNLTYSLGWIVDFYLPWSALATTFGLGLLVAIIAAWYPARKVSELEIVEAIEYE